ncbi:hypothetical protein Esti_006441 [Eimeria stiedai]
MAATEQARGAPLLEGLPSAASTSAEPLEASRGPAVSEKQASLCYPAEGEMVILYASRDCIFSCILEPQGVCRTRFGSFLHADIIKTPIGHKVFDRKNGKWLVVLRPTPDLHTLALRHRTQIIYHADISLIVSLLDVRPGKTIIEAGTGSGSLSHSLAAALRPGGRLFTFEFHLERWEEAKKEFELLGVSPQVTCLHRDVCKEGFCLQLPNAAADAAAATGAAAGDVFPRPHEADGVFLDLPSPWLALKHADQVLKGGGRLVTFSPCVEQLHKTLVAAQELGFQDFQAFEIFAKPWGACVSRPVPAPREGAKRAMSAGSGGPHEETDLEEGESGPMDHRDTHADTFPALLSHFLQQPLSPYLAGEATPAAAGTGAPAAAAKKGAPLDSLKRISAYHYQLPMKGHTGYVACCVRPSEDEAHQRLP